MLGDATGFASGDPGFADRVQQAGLAVVHVAHDSDHGRTPDQVSEIALFDHLDGLGRRFLDVVLEHRNAEFLGHRLDR